MRYELFGIQNKENRPTSSSRYDYPMPFRYQTAATERGGSTTRTRVNQIVYGIWSSCVQQVRHTTNTNRIRTHDVKRTKFTILGGQCVRINHIYEHVCVCVCLCVWSELSSVAPRIETSTHMTTQLHTRTACIPKLFICKSFVCCIFLESLCL